MKRQTNRQTDRDKQTDRQTQRQRDRQTETDRQRVADGSVSGMYTRFTVDAWTVCLFW